MTRGLVVGGLCIAALAAPANAEMVEVRRADLGKPEQAIYDRLQALSRQRAELSRRRARFAATDTKADDAALAVIDAKLREVRRGLAATILGDGYQSGAEAKSSCSA